MGQGDLAFTEARNRLASRPPEGMVALYTSYADCGLKLPLSSFLEEVLRFCGISFSQISLAALDRLLTFSLLCRRSGVETSLAVFRIWFQITSMSSDPRRMLISQRGGFPLFDHLSDRSHNWRDRFFFVSLDALGPIDLDSSPSTHWGLLTQLKTHTTLVAHADLEPQQANANEVLIKVYRRADGPALATGAGSLVGWISTPQVFPSPACSLSPSAPSCGVFPAAFPDLLGLLSLGGDGNTLRLFLFGEFLPCLVSSMRNLSS